MGRLGVLAVGCVAVVGAMGQRLAGQQPGSITGAVVDAVRGEGIAGADVAVLAERDSSVVAATTTRAGGRFLVLELRPDAYLVTIRAAGHRTLTTAPLSVRPGRTTDAGILRLGLAPLRIDSLTVVTERPAVTYEADRTAYDVEAMGLGTGGTVMDALIGIPGLDVGLDGQVRVRGQSPRIYLNGRPIPLQGLSLEVFIEQYPAGLIDRIEVIHDPGAAFAAEGTGGIVNIVLKKGAELGSTTILFGGAGTRGERRLGVRATRQKGTLTFDGGGNVGWSDVRSTSFDLRQNLLTQPATFTRQDGSTRRSSLQGDGSVGAQWRMDAKTHLGLTATLSRSGGDSRGLTTTTRMDELRTPTLRYDQRSASLDRALSGDVRLRFGRVWKPRRQELTVDVEWQRGSTSAGQSLDAATGGLSAPGVVVPPQLTRDNTRAHVGGGRLSIDYRHPLGRAGQLSVGYAADLHTEDNRRARKVVEDSAQEPGVETVDAYTRTQLVNAAYASLTRTIGRFTLRGGVRVERTDMTFDVPGLGAFGNGYTDPFPSASVGYVTRGGKHLQLTYSRRVGRPAPDILDPRNTSADPLNRRVGNPHIEPQFTHSVSANEVLPFGRVTVVLAPYWRRVANGWAPITSVDSEGVSTRTYENLAGETNYGTTLVAALRPSPRWTMNLSVGVRRDVRDADNLATRYSGTSTLWSTGLIATAHVGSSVFVTGHFAYTPPVDLPQGRSSGTKRSDFSIRYQLLDRRASFRLSLMDPFDLARRSTTNTSDLSYVEIGRSSRTDRRASLGFSYVLGRMARTRRP